MRVAVSQFATTSSSQDNLATCIQMITKAAQCKPSIIILPECCNSEPNYRDHNQAWHEALALDGIFLQQIAEQARKNQCYIAINITLRRDVNRTHQNGKLKSNISVTSCLFSCQGELVQQENKLHLSKEQSQFFTCADQLEQKLIEVIKTPFAKLGLLLGNETNNYQKTRKLALESAQLLCHSMHSNSLDQNNIHIPSRALENNIFIASANKLTTYGKSQIVSPDGKVLAEVAQNQTGYAYADISIDKSGIENKCRPDGTHLKTQLRPELYQKLQLDIEKTKKRQQAKAPNTANVAIFATYKSNEQAIEDVCHYIENNLSDIIVLPELFFLSDKNVTLDINQRAQLTKLGEQAIAKISTALRPLQYVCTSLVIDGKHQAVIINELGLLASQQQLHFCQRYHWTSLSNELSLIVLPLEQGAIKLAMLTADDANIAEMLSIASFAGIELLLVPFDIQDSAEVEHHLMANAAENRLCIIAASREKDFTDELLNKLLITDSESNPFSKNKIKTKKSTGLIINLAADESILPQWRKRKFNGYINQPLIKLQYGKITKAVVHPIAAHKKIPVNLA